MSKIKKVILKANKNDKKVLEEFLIRGTFSDYKEAINYFTKAIDIDPNYAMAYDSRGRVYESMEDYPKAISDYSKVIDLEPNNAKAYIERAKLYETKILFSDIELDHPNTISDCKNAISDYTIAIELNPKDSKIYNLRGRLYEKIMKDYSKAIMDFTKAIELDPTYALAYENRGLVYFKIIDYDKAIFDFSKELELKPNSESAYSNRGSVYESIKDYDKAIYDYTKAIENNPKNEFIYLMRSRVYNTIGDKVNSMKDFQIGMLLSKWESISKKYKMIEKLFYDRIEYSGFFMEQREFKKLSPDGKFIATLNKIDDGKWLYMVASRNSDKCLGEYVRPFPNNDEYIIIFNKGCAEIARRLIIYIETNDLSLLPKRPAFDRLSYEATDDLENSHPPQK